MNPNINIQNRELSDAEIQRMQLGFDEHTIENGVEVQDSDRVSYVAMDEDQFIGCSSGLAYKNGVDFSAWFYLTDLYVEKPYRYQHIGKELLLRLEGELKSKGINNIWTWTAGYEAPEFYEKQGYEIFTEMKNWYSDGSSRIGMKKKL